MRFLMIGAHPDDMDLRCGGLAVLLKDRGHEARFLSLTNGNAGHQSMDREALRERRMGEMKKAGAVYGLQYDTLDVDDGYLMPDVPTRNALLRYIRSYAPDVIITHRTCDYHPDHRATGQLVNDCSYLVGVPLVCPDVPALRKPPVILSCEDKFTSPAPFRPDIAVCIDSVIDQKIRGVLQHTSQFYEWLPYDGHWEDVLNAPDPETATGNLIKRHQIRFAGPVQKYREVFPENVIYGEVYQIDEYGGPMTAEILNAMTGR